MGVGEVMERRGDTRKPLNRHEPVCLHVHALRPTSGPTVTQ